MKLMTCWLIPISFTGGLLALAAAQPEPARLSDVERAFAYAKLAPTPERYVLAGATLPTFEFAQPEEARKILGAYQLKVTVYDPEYQRVTQASKPGRHGAVVEIIPEKTTRLPASRRFITLYRLPDQTSFAQQAPALVARLKGLRWNFKDVPGANTADNALHLAALHEAPRDADPSDFYQQPIEKNRQWWIGLKRRLYGFDRHPRFALPFRAPLPLDGKPAPVIRKGTLAEAGMKPEAARQIDDVLNRWAGDSDEGFDVCVVRHGVVVWQKPYGKYRGKEVTDTTMFHLTSTSKFITGLLLMMLVELGLLDLDMPISDLPGPLQGLKTEKPITLRALYTHTAFTDPVGIAPTPDMEERLALILPHLPIGKGYQYTGTSLELAWALASMATGKSISTFARDHLAEPLGCKHTEVFNTGGATQSTAHDLARVWQMVLNRGVYGDKRFLSPQSVAEMLPRRLTQTLGPYTNDRSWGIGTMPWKVDGLSPFTFGHKGYYRSTAFIDPIHELVVIMTRVDPPTGKKYDKYHPQFLKAIVDGLIDPVPAFPEALTLTNLDVPAGKSRVVIETVVENTGPTDAVLEYRYETVGTRWQFEPSAARIKLPARTRTPIRVEARIDPDHLAALPKLRGAIYSAAGPAPPTPHLEYWLRPILRRTVTAQRVGKPPQDKPHLLETHGRKDPQYPAQFHVAYDDNALYVTVKAAEKNVRQLPVAARQRDEVALKKEDHIELVINPTADPKSRRQFAVNLHGVQYDALAGNVKWDAGWTSTIRFEDDQYVAEFAIPYEALRTKPPRPGERWSLNVLRGRGSGNPKWETYSQWVMTYADFNSDKHLGVLLFK